MTRAVPQTWRGLRCAPRRACAQRSGAELLNALHQAEDFEKTSLRHAVAIFHSTFLDALLLEVRSLVHPAPAGAPALTQLAPLSPSKSCTPRGRTRRLA